MKFLLTSPFEEDLCIYSRLADILIKPTFTQPIADNKLTANFQTFPRVSKLIILAAVSWIIWNLQASSVQASPCSELLNISQRPGFNTRQEGNLIVLGRLPKYHYVVVVPSGSEATLEQVRQCVPDALIAKSNLGNYILAGSFPDQSSAKSIYYALRSLRLDARIIYVR
ncbi:hypothetical protein NDI49_22150 [Trichocoleus sp. ST-U3]|uniref:hypothetical protein n=1 Tax=Coleofasciculus sp. FACHB-542 TaxID=2692787 RepID=UPI0016871D71|nr:hypothetical protein [Coleofasciculus sp. FACHB-542]MBD2085700.1 hypothetical protein [Coleofasciculus sp. FACHB-542]